MLGIPQRSFTKIDGCLKGIIMKKEFLHCLRIQFFPNHYEDERIAEVVEYCVKYGFKNVVR